MGPILRPDFGGSREDRTLANISPPPGFRHCSTNISPALTPPSLPQPGAQTAVFSCFAPAAATYGRCPVWWAVWRRFSYPSGVVPALGPWCQCACEATGPTIPVFREGAGFCCSLVCQCLNLCLNCIPETHPWCDRTPVVRRDWPSEFQGTRFVNRRAVLADPTAKATPLGSSTVSGSRTEKKKPM